MLFTNSLDLLSTPFSGCSQILKLSTIPPVTRVRGHYFGACFCPTKYSGCAVTWKQGTGNRRRHCWRNKLRLLCVRTPQKSANFCRTLSRTFMRSFWVRDYCSRICQTMRPESTPSSSTHPPHTLSCRKPFSLCLSTAVPSLKATVKQTQSGIRHGVSFEIESIKGDTEAAD